MPHLSELQEKYKDYGVTIIGVSDEPLATVVPFLFTTWKADNKVQNDRIQYTLTTDPDESVKNDYFRAAGRTGIPCSFIIGKTGHVEWIGHPMSMDEPLDAVVFDRWDRDTYRARMEREQAAEKKLRTAYQNEDWETVLGIYKDLLKDDPENVGVMMQTFGLLLTQMNKPDEAYALGEKLVKTAWDEASTLNGVAWMVVDDPEVKTRNLDFALKAAKRANELTQSKDAAILDTLARVFYEKGDLKQAVKWQRLAAENATEGPMADDIHKTLQKYETDAGK
jgi:tetratricopeptide (TPR) repeat protein